MSVHFDLDQDILIYADSNGHMQLPLARLREPESEPVQRNEFAPFEVPSPPQIDITGFPPPHQNPQRSYQTVISPLHRVLFRILPVDSTISSEAIMQISRSADWQRRSSVLQLAISKLGRSPTCGGSWTVPEHILRSLMCRHGNRMEITSSTSEAQSLL